MVRRILITGVTAAAIAGTGAAAIALTGPTTTSGSPGVVSVAAVQSAAQPAQRARPRIRRGRLVRGQFVVRRKDGFVTHDVIAGTVRAVSATSITVLAADQTSETFALNQATKYREHANGTKEAATASAVRVGDHVIVAGTGTTALTAKHVAIKK